MEEILDQLRSDMLKTFARFEYALKAAGFHNGNGPDSSLRLLGETLGKHEVMFNDPGPTAHHRVTRHARAKTSFLLETKIRNPQARGVVTHNALNILWEAVSGLGVDIERQRHDGAANTIQLAQD
jgi:hypothetical protein